MNGYPKLSVGAQVTIDAILCVINRKKWIGSKQRAALFQRWVSGEIIETLDVLMIAARIKQALVSRGVREGVNALEYHSGEEKVVDKDLDWDTWLPLMEKWVVKQPLFESFEDRLYSTYQAGRGSAEAARKHIVPHAIRLLKTSKDEETQRYAAKWLAEMDDLTDEQLTIVKDLKNKATNLRIRSLLDSAIRRSTWRGP